jgi:oligopeptide/dipeptide ABC transporter ATP-binding protein
MNSPLLEIKNLKTHFRVRNGIIKAVDGLDFHLNENETLGIVGESGSGKSLTALSILGLIPPPGKVVEGKIMFKSKNLIKMSNKEITQIRGGEISMIFQEPMSALNPLLTVGKQISEAITTHQKIGRGEAKERVYDMIDQVGIADPKTRYGEYPHQFSGGQRQRFMIAMALACRPSLLIADEPTTALDVTCQAQILELIETLQQEIKTSVILISHDLGIVAEFVQRVVVMYTGTMMESADVNTLFEEPAHPYTKALMKAIPYLGNKERKKHLYEIPGMIPSLKKLPQGCKFHPRCNRAEPLCAKDEPPLKKIDNGHWAKCWFV